MNIHVVSAEEGTFVEVNVGYIVGLFETCSFGCNVRVPLGLFVG